MYHNYNKKILFVDFDMYSFSFYFEKCDNLDSSLVYAYYRN